MNGQNRKQYGDMLDEADIGSGEREPGQQDTDRIIEQIGQRLHKQSQRDSSGSGRRSGKNDGGGKGGSRSR